MVSQIPRIIEMNVAVDDGEVWQLCLSSQCNLVGNGSVGPEQPFMLELRPDIGWDFAAHEGNVPKDFFRSDRARHHR